jgi:5-methyltetrahydropteroyltriglutamate--homocysteine methyltransferase
VDQFWSDTIDAFTRELNRLLAASPKEMHIGMHLCRGNRGGHWHAEGSYEEVAERVFNALAIQFYFLEYDTPRAGSFTPLRFVPKHKSVVLGLVSTKISQLEDIAALKSRLDEATKFARY